MTKPKTTKPASPWVNCKSRMPDPGVEVLSCRDGDVYLNETFIDEESRQRWWVDRPSHWMPIPPLPEGER